MFARITKQIISAGRLSRTVYSRTFNTAAIKLCNNCGGLYSVFLQNNTVSSNATVLNQVRQFSNAPSELNEAQFIDICEETLHSLYECFEEIVDKHLSQISDVDVMYEGGILKVDLGFHGVYIINRQTPNKQIWLSSPKSGPKRYDYVKETKDKGYWIYKHDGVSLHKLLQTEINHMLCKEVDFSHCAFSKL